MQERSNKKFELQSITEYNVNENLASVSSNNNITIEIIQNCQNLTDISFQFTS